jgi:hypothetical protein
VWQRLNSSLEVCGGYIRQPHKPESESRRRTTDSPHAYNSQAVRVRGVVCRMCIICITRIIHINDYKLLKNVETTAHKAIT